MELTELLGQVRRVGDFGGATEHVQFEHLPTFADQLQIIRPKNVLAVIAVPPRLLTSRRQWLHLIAIANHFRTDFAVIHRLAAGLAPTVLNTGIVPIIEALHERDLADISQDAGAIRAMVERGSLLYERS